MWYLQIIRRAVITQSFQGSDIATLIAQLDDLIKNNFGSNFRRKLIAFSKSVVAVLNRFILLGKLNKQLGLKEI